MFNLLPISNLYSFQINYNEANKKIALAICVQLKRNTWLHITFNTYMCMFYLHYDGELYRLPKRN